MTGLTTYQDSGRREDIKGNKGVKYMTKAKLGSGARFKALKKKLAGKGARTPGALAAYIGRKKYGKSKFAKLSARGRKAA
jgi:hypothetical protein